MAEEDDDYDMAMMEAEAAADAQQAFLHDKPILSDEFSQAYDLEYQ